MFIQAFMHLFIANTRHEKPMKLLVYIQCISLWVTCTTCISAFYWIKISWIFNHKNVSKKPEEVFISNVKIGRISGYVLSPRFKNQWNRFINVLTTLHYIFLFLKNFTLIIYLEFRILILVKTQRTFDQQKLGTSLYKFRCCWWLKGSSILVITATFMNAYMNFLRILQAASGGTDWNIRRIQERNFWRGLSVNTENIFIISGVETRGMSRYRSIYCRILTKQIFLLT
jgi:hypothetical protein